MLQQVIPNIDGVNYVRRIALQSNVQVDLVKNCMRQLLYYECIAMIDIFQYSNIYATTPQLNRLARDDNLQNECIGYIQKDGHTLYPGTFHKIFALYCSIQPSIRVSDFCVLYANSLKSINVAKFIAFGLIHAFLRRVHKYPIRAERHMKPVDPRNSLATWTGIPDMEVMDGNHNTDEICCKYLMDYSDLDAIVGNDKRCFVVYK